MAAGEEWGVDLLDLEGARISMDKVYTATDRSYLPVRVCTNIHSEGRMPHTKAPNLGKQSQACSNTNISRSVWL